MSQVQTAVLTELQAAQALRRKLREKVGEACSEQRARYSELEGVLVTIERSVDCGECSDELLEQAARLNRDLKKLRRHLKDGWAVRLSA